MIDHTASARGEDNNSTLREAMMLMENTIAAKSETVSFATMR